MLIALYQTHHQLPFWGGETNPFDIFSPGKHGAFPFKGGDKIEVIDGQRTHVGNEMVSLKDAKYLFSFLSGLHDVECDYLIAHVSALCNCQLEKKGWWHYPKRVWVQITTRPNEFTKEGLPIVYDIIGRCKSEIHHVWGGDNGTHSPYDFFSDEKIREKASNDPRIWTRFFVEHLDLDPNLKALKDRLQVAKSNFADAQEAVEQVQLFGAGCLNTNLTIFNAC
jgi:hypothetical protein